MVTSGSRLGCGTSLALGGLAESLVAILLNGGTWSVTRNLPSPGLRTQPEAKGHSLKEWGCLVCYQVFNLVSNYVAYG